MGNELSWSKSIWRTTRPQHKLVFQSVAKSYLKAREIGVHSVREKQELGWIETEKVRTCIVGRRTKENWECRNSKPRGAAVQRACAHRGHDRGVSERDTQGKTMQNRGTTGKRQGAKTRETPVRPTTENQENQAQQKKPVEKARTRGACQAPRRGAAKYAAKTTVTGGSGHSRDDITSLTAGTKGTREDQARRPDKVSVSPNPACVKILAVNFTKQRNACMRCKDTYKVERIDLAERDNKTIETTRRLITWKRELLPPKPLLAVPLMITESKECHVITKKNRRACRTLNPKARETIT